MKSIIGIILIILSAAQSNAQALWQAAEAYTKTYGQQYLFPEKFNLFSMNQKEFLTLQALIPLENETHNIHIMLPNPDGEMQDFFVFSNQTMAPALATKYPTIQTYTAINAKDKSIVAKLDFTNYGFHAMVMNGDDTYFIDPYTDVQTPYYICYYKRNYSKPLQHRMHCELDESIEPGSIGLQNELSAPTTINHQYKTNGSIKRDYRLALACTGEYAVAVAGASPIKANVLSKMVTSINRVNGVYEKELSVHLTLVANTDTLIELDGATDGYTNTSGSTLLTENQLKINSIIGTANYDIGHVFSTGGGGIASLASVCGTNKARGVTGSSSPVGDPFDIDYVCHEVGHQFNGSHTFDASTGSCNGNRSSNSAYEVGSGTTLMAYAGICDINNVQNNSDDYFSIKSLSSISTFIVGTGNCATNTNTNNTPPVITAIQKNYYIPYLTFFEVNGTATDADKDSISYCWEEFDRSNTSMSWNGKTTRNPIFRSFSPRKNNDRVFPKIQNCINNIYSVIGERVPDTNRTVTLKLCVRDVQNGYGSFNYSDDSITVKTIKTIGLFRVTTQANNPTYNGYDLVNVLWDVAGTDTDPNINTANVSITMSADGGYTYPYSAGTFANNGSATIGMPNISTSLARIKIKGVDNIFFDLNDKNFTITKNNNVPLGVANYIENQIDIYPNPTQSGMTVNGIVGNFSVHILNQLGQICMQQQAVNEAKINMAHLQNGIYFAKITLANGQMIVKKIVLHK
jgi:Metallo-peptidase family M12/Secretion system C-terminal sorting domain